MEQSSPGREGEAGKHAALFRLRPAQLSRELEAFRDVGCSANPNDGFFYVLERPGELCRIPMLLPREMIRARFMEVIDEPRHHGLLPRGFPHERLQGQSLHRILRCIEE